MEIAMKSDGSNMEARELTLNELDDASGGILPLIGFCVAAFEFGFAVGMLIGEKLK